jgi:hypothetical protein
VELVFGPRRRPPDDRILVFHHIRKTAGSSLKASILRNVPQGNRVRLPYPNVSAAMQREWWRELVASMTPVEKASLWAVSSHFAGFCLDLFPRVQGVTMIREPIDLVLSRLFFRADQSADLSWLREYYTETGKPRDSNTQAGRLTKAGWYNPQARTLLAPHFDVSELRHTLGPPPDANVWRERLFTLVSGRFLVGLQEAYDDSVRLFAEKFGWRDLTTPAVKVNENRPRELPLDEAMADLICRANWLDLELYSAYARTFDRVPRLRLQEATGGSADRVRGYVVERPAAADPVEQLRSELDLVRDQLAAETHAQGLRIRAVESELRRAHAELEARDGAAAGQGEGTPAAPVDVPSAAANDGRSGRQRRRRANAKKPQRSSVQSSRRS